MLRNLIVALLLGLGLASMSAVASAKPPPASVYGALPLVSDVAISPNGKLVAIARNKDGVSSLFVLRLEDFRPIMNAAIEQGSNLRGVGWADDEIATVWMSRSFSSFQAGAYGPSQYFEFRRVGAVDLTTQRFRFMMGREEHAGAYTSFGGLYAPIDDDPDYGRMVAPTALRGPLAVHRVNLRTGDGRAIQHLSSRTDDWVLDAKGEAVARVDADEAKNTWQVLAKRGDAWKPVLEGEGELGNGPPLLGLLPDGRVATLIYDEEGAQLATLRALDLAAGETELLYSAAPFDVSGAIIDPYTRLAVGVEWIDDTGVRQHFFDAELAKTRGIVDATGGQYLRILGWSRDRKRFVAHNDVLEVGSFYLYDVATNEVTLVAETYPELPDAALATTTVVRYKARDKATITAYLTLPPGKSNNLPAILLPHGGPEARDDAAFDYWAQFLASRGYAVIRPNFRGSEGYGRAWARAGDGEWGGLMQRDLEDAVAAVAKAGMIDPSRVCIVGASYGGYAALVGATLTASLYRCAISVNGVADLDRFVSERMELYGKRSSTSDYWQRSIGRLRQDRQAIRAVSPYDNAEKATIPILLIHGAKDSVVPPNHSSRMASKLRDLGKTVEHVELEGDDHYLSLAATRTRMLEEVERFLAKHLAAE